jgi:hypothetical protein
MAFGSGPPATARTAPPLPNPALVGGMNPPQGASPAIAHLLAGLAAAHGAPMSMTAHPPMLGGPPRPPMGPPGGPGGPMPMVHPGAAPLPQGPMPGAGPPAMPMMAPGSAAPGMPPGAGPPRPAMPMPPQPAPGARAPFPAKKPAAKAPPRAGLRTERV